MNSIIQEKLLRLSPERFAEIAQECFNLLLSILENVSDEEDKTLNEKMTALMDDVEQNDLLDAETEVPQEKREEAVKNLFSRYYSLLTESLSGANKKKLEDGVNQILEQAADNTR